MSTPPAWLLPDFDPSKIKVAELRGILLQHSIPYSSTAKKGELVQAFETSIRPHAKTLLAQVHQVRASTDGILDGESQDGSLAELNTTEDEEPKPKVKARPRKSAAGARKGKAKAVGAESDDAEPESVKRPRARKSTQMAEVTMELLSDEEPVVEEPAVEVPRKRRQASAGPEEHKRLKSDSSPADKDRRQSVKYESGPESGFSDFNPFQSGEDSPEAKPRRRKSSMGPQRPRSSLAGPSTSASARKSLPAPSTSGQLGSWKTSDADIPPSPAIPARFLDTPNRPVASGSSHATPGVKYMIPLDRVKRTPPDSELAKLQRKLGIFEQEDRVEDEVEDEVEDQVEDVVEQVFEEAPRPSPRTRESRSKDGPRDGVARTEIRKTPAPKKGNKVVVGGPRRSIPASSIVTRKPSSLVKYEAIQRISLGSVVLGFLLCLLWWREEKIAAGFCDTGSTSNALVASRTGSLTLPTWLPPPPPQILSFLDSSHLRPSCTTCPAHAICRDGSFLTCAPEYVPRVHPLSLGGLLPFAPICRPDTEKLMAVAMQASRAAGALRKRRGEVECGSGEKGRKGEGKGEAWVYGLGRGELLEALMREYEESDSPFESDVMEEINRLALADLEAHDEVVTSEEDNELWYASKTADMPLSCRARRAAIRHAEKHKSEISGLVSALLAILWLRAKFRKRQVEGKRVRQLVQATLQHLRDQERLHYIDPVLSTTAHVAPSHLRDLVLQEEHSPARRQLLWKQVEKVVEGNSNVRAKQVELNGEETRVWEWAGQRDLHVSWDKPQSPGTGLYPTLP